MYHVRAFYQPQPPPPLKTLDKMDPDCAICHAPATRACDCEANSLETAIRQAEARAMQSVFNELRYAFFLRCGLQWGLVLRCLIMLKKKTWANINHNVVHGSERTHKTIFSNISVSSVTGESRPTRPTLTASLSTPTTTTMHRHTPARSLQPRRP